jgi:LacI family transcriptional regulator
MKKSLTTPPRRIALAFPNTLVIAGNILHGIHAFARTRPGWTFTRMPEQINPSATWLRHWKGDGALTAFASVEEARLACRLPYPVVNLVSYIRRRELPSVTLDNREIGRLQAAHLLDRRFQRLVYYGVCDLWYSRERWAGFQAAARSAGTQVVRWLVPSGTRLPERWTDQQAELARRLQRIVTPFAVATSTDLRACMVMEACVTLGLRIPEDVAVIGMDNDPTVAPFTVPPLTSVERNDRELGYRAAGLLNDLIEGQEQKAPHVMVQPAGIVERRSTETLAVDDPTLDQLICAIRDNLSTPFGVEFLLARTTMSRRKLESLLHQHLGCPPYALINRLRVEHASRLLTADASQTLSSIATACGFTDLRHFRIVFQRQTGLSPAAFRKQSQAGRH